MVKLSLIFLTVSLIKGALMFLNILAGDWLPTFPITLRYLILFILFWFIDRISLAKINGQINRIIWLKSTLFLFGTYILNFIISVLFLIIYSRTFGLKAKPVSGSIVGPLIGFLLFGLALICINVSIYLKRRK